MTSSANDPVTSTPPARRRLASRSLSALVLSLVSAGLMLPHAPLVQAGNLPYSEVVNVNTINYVVNVDWDFDAPPAQAKNPDQLLDRNYITTVLRGLARSKFIATEGRHRVGTVLVYRNSLLGNNVDIRMLNSDGRSSAHPAGWGKRDKTSFNYMAFQGAPETIDAYAKVINHELGHYTYGLVDEYREDGAELKADEPGSPSKLDTPKNSAMNDHLRFESFSVPADYADPATRQTAQARVYATNADGTGGSAWEVLTRPASRDPAKAADYGRTFFDAFANVDLSRLTLQRNATGFDAALNVVFVTNPVFRDVIAVDRTVGAQRLDELKQAAKGMVNNARGNTQFALVVTPPVNGQNVVLPLTATDDAGKARLSSAIDALTPDGGDFDGLALANDAARVVGSMRALGDMSTVHLMSIKDVVLPEAMGPIFRASKLAVNTLGLPSPTAPQARAAGTRLADLARMSGGMHNTATTGAEAAKDATKAMNDAHSEAASTIAVAESAPLAAGARFSTSFRVASGATDSDVAAEVYFDPADAAKLGFVLRAPDGALYTVNSQADGIDFDLDPTEGVLSVTIGADLPGRTGKWELIATASAALTDGLAFEAVSLGRLALTGEFTGGAMGDTTPPVLTAVLGGVKRVRNAVVMATVFKEDGTVVLNKVAMRDDGVAPDARANDGIYTLSLDGKLEPGSYGATITAVNDGTARIASLGALIKGVRDEETPIEAFERFEEVGFAVDKGALGVRPDPAAPVSELGDNVGCTTSANGRDASLLSLLAMAVLGLWLRRRRGQ